MDETTAILQDAYELMARGEEHWTRGALWRDANGHILEAGFWPKDLHAACLAGWTIEAAARRRNADKFAEVGRDALVRLAFAVCGEHPDGKTLAFPEEVIGDFNDDEHTSYDDALLALKREAFK